MNDNGHAPKLPSDADQPGQNPTDETALDETALDDTALGAALGDAIGQRVEALYVPPPVASIADRAAARTKARDIRRTTGTLAASMILLVGGIVGWNAISDQDGDQSELATTEIEGSPASPDVDDVLPSETVSEPGEPSPSSDREFETITPERLSTGPVLDWVEIESGIEDVGNLDSLPDGRILARSFAEDGETLLVSDNGLDWSSVSTPPGIFLNFVDVSGERWLASGSVGEDFDDIHVFISDDEGASWTPLAVDFSVGEPRTAPFLIDRSYLSAALVSGERVVLVSQTFTEVDIVGLLTSRGYVDGGADILGWGWGEGTITAEIGDPFQPETLELTYEELGLTEAEIKILEELNGPNDKVRIFAGDETGLELVEEFLGGGGTGYSSGSGFAVTLFGENGTTLLTSVDGLTWAESQLDSFFDVVGGVDGSIWSGGFENGSYELQRSGNGGPSTTVTTLPGIQPNGRLSVGPAGIATTVSPSGGSAAFDEPGEFELPAGVVEKDGFELRYNEPVGGITLYDVAAGAPVYVFGPETLEGEAAPEGVREVEGDSESEFGIIFVDPDTGEDLVAFTMEDLSEVLDLGPGAGVETALEPDEAPFGLPESWVGWSADGTAWGWERVEDAFGAVGNNSWVEIAVGDGFVIARVEEFDESFESAAIEDGGSSSSGSVTAISEGHEQRWFIATVD
jgi:hypothetical protein